jgi:sulfite exporter TauE/SafE
VLAQVAEGLARRPASAGAPMGLARLRGGLLLPYHLGRATTYCALGAAAGGASAFVVRSSGFSWVLAAFLVAAAVLFLVQGLRGLGLWFGGGTRAGGVAGWVGLQLARRLGPLFRNPVGPAGYLLGVALGFLPCGFLYAALATAAGSGGALAGGLAMAAFVAGTVPPLVVVGTLGAAAGAGWTGVMRALAPALYLVNGGLLLLAAWHAAAG